MKILLYGINFSPELVGIGKYSGELAAWLAAQGHEIDVVTAPPYYPEWKVHANHRASAYAREIWRGVKVFRTPVWVPRRPSGLKRILHLASFALSSLPVLAWRLARRPDVVIVIEPPLFCAPAALLGASLCGSRSWLHIQDHEVDAAFELGMLSGKVLRRLVLAAERFLLRRFTRVSTISTKMLDRTRDKGVAPERLALLPNWIDVDAIAPSGDLRAELAIPATACVALYSGNMGAKQGLEILGQVAALLAAHRNLHFIFCGDGPQRQMLEQATAGLANVLFLPLQPLDRFPRLLATADIHLLPQRRDAADLVMPSKLGAMLASGKPLVCATPPATELASVVQHCGLLTPPEDARAMAHAVLRLTRDAELRARLGAAGRAYARTRLDAPAVLRRFEQALIDCLPRSNRPGTQPN